MSDFTLGSALPEFDLPATGDKNIKSSDLLGKGLVLYFYPKASTPGCTTEGKEFSAAHAQFQALNIQILGVSRDGIKAQTNFKTKQGFVFDLLADKEELLCRACDVIKLKKMYGKESLGIERSTFFFDADGILKHEWRKVKVAGHVDEVLDKAKELFS